MTDLKAIAAEGREILAALKTAQIGSGPHVLHALFVDDHLGTLLDAADRVADLEERLADALTLATYAAHRLDDARRTARTQEPAHA